MKKKINKIISALILIFGILFMINMIIIGQKLINNYFLLYEREQNILQYGQDKVSLRYLSSLNANFDEFHDETRMLYEAYKNNKEVTFTIKKKMPYTDDYYKLFDFYLKDFYVELFPNLSVDMLVNSRINFDIIPSIKKYYSDGVIYKVEVSLSKKYVDNYQRLINIDTWIRENFDETMSQGEALKCLGNYLMDNCVYDDSYNKESYYIYAVLENKAAVCQGYSVFYQYVCRSLGIECYYSWGDTDKESHAWNRVVLGGKDFFVDSTWGYDHYLFLLNVDYLFSTDLWDDRTMINEF